MSWTTMSAARPSGDTRGTVLLSALRHIAGVVVGGIIGAVVWLIVMQEGSERHWSDHDYNQMVGQVVVDRTGDVAKTGFWVTLVLGIALAAVYAVVVEPLVGRARRVRAMFLFALVPFLLWGLVLSPGVTAYKDTALDVARETIPGGAFGLDGGGATLVLGMIASMLFALAVTRIYRLMCEPEWWRARGGDHAMAQGVLDELTSRSLELSEERREEGREGPGR